MHSLLPHWTSVGFTGHRKLKNPQVVTDALRSVLDELTATHGPLSAISSAASGADTLFVEEVARRRIPYFLALPFRRDRFQRDFTAEEWSRVASYFDGALAVEEAEDDDSATDGYMECGVRTVDHADVMIAVWDGEPASGLGGTGDIVDYARGLEKPLIWIDAATGAVRRERMESAPRHDAPRELDESTPPRALVEQQFNQFNAVAKHHGPAAEQLTLTIIRLHLAATALAIAGLVLAVHGTADHVLSLVKLGALAACLVLAWRHRQCHHEWINSRMAAEICRSYLALWPMRRRGAHFPTPSPDESSGLVRSLQMLWRLDRQSEVSFDEARELYATGRVRHQLEYFDREYKADGRHAARLQAIAVTATVASLVFISLALLISLKSDKSPLYKPVKLLAVVLPLIPPAALSVVVANDLARRAARHGDVTDRLRRAQRRLELCRTWPSLWRQAMETEDLLMREVAEWHALARYAGESH